MQAIPRHAPAAEDRPKLENRRASERMHQVEMLPHDDQVHVRAANVAFRPRVGDADAVMPLEAMRFIKGKSAIRLAIHPKGPVGKPPDSRHRLGTAVFGVPGSTGQILDGIVVEAGAPVPKLPSACWPARWCWPSWALSLAR